MRAATKRTSTDDSTAKPKIDNNSNAQDVADFCEMEDVLPIGYVLRVAVIVNLWFDGAVVGAGAFGGRSQRTSTSIFLMCTVDL